MKPDTFALKAVCLGLVVAVLCSCSNDAAKNAEWEKKHKAAIENFIARSNGTLKVGSIAVSALDKSFTLDNVTGSVSVPVNYPVPGAGTAQSQFEFSMARVRGEGLNTSDAPGTADTLKKLTVTDWVMSSKFEGLFKDQPSPGQETPVRLETVTSKGSASEYAYHDVKGDFSVFPDLFFGRFDKEAVAKLATFSIGEGTMKNLLGEGFVPDIGGGAGGKTQSIRYTAASVSQKAFDVNGAGPAEMKDIGFFFGDRQVASMETMSIKSMAIPGLMEKLLPLDELWQKEEEELKKIMLEQEIVVDDMRVANLRITPEPDITFTLKDGGFSFRNDKSAGALKIDVQDLVIPLEALYDGKDTGESSIDFKSVYDKPLSISLVFDLDREQKASQAGEYVIRLKRIYFAESNLGSVNVSAEMNGKTDEQAEENEYPFDLDGFSLVRAALGIKDSGMVDLGFRVAALMDGTGLAKEDRAALLRKLAGFVLTTQCARVSQALHGVCMDLDKFIQVPGEFELSFAPSQPLRLDELAEMLMSADDPKKIGLSWKYTPPKQ
ncbi:MAG: hypothetical protein LBU06_12465 [Desulfovibrio sp.]|nr:hypothetical protein [Desulfovibrio sp.]